MADYTPIPLQVQVPDQMHALSGMLNMAQAAQNYRLGQDTYDAKVLNANSTASSAQSKATVDAANVNPLIDQQIAKTSQEQTKAASDKFGLSKDYMGTALQTASGLTQDPRLAAGPNYSEEAAANAIAEAENQMINKGVPPAQAKMATAPLYMQVHMPGAVQQMLKNTITGNMAPAAQGTAISPSTSFVSTDKGTQPYNTNPLSGPVGPTGATMAPPNQFVTTPTGRMGVANPASGTVNEPQPANSQQPPVNRPVGETAETQNALQAERDTARQTALASPVMHDINRTIIDTINNGNASTGKWGALVRDIKSRVPGMNDAQGATDYDIVGKMLERSALTAAQSMGQHTVAGLEANRAANGTVSYSEPALKKIAYLNDALNSGAELYHQGLEKTIASSPNNVFAKRDFDTQWGKLADPQVLRLKNAVDNHNQEEIDAVNKEVGGKGSAGAAQLHKKLTGLLSMVQ